MIKKPKNKFDFHYKDKCLDLVEQLQSKEDIHEQERQRLQEEITSLKNQIEATRELLNYITDLNTIEKKMTSIDKLNNKIVALLHKRDALEIVMRNKFNEILERHTKTVNNDLKQEFYSNLEILNIELFGKLYEVKTIIENIQDLGGEYYKASNYTISEADGIHLKSLYTPTLKTFGIKEFRYFVDRGQGTLNSEKVEKIREVLNISE